ncbi:MAG: hypothetical protein LBH91_01815 [Prevotellaceae bacterium]|jgi:C-terminal processing protease CtpA/Prc|nr:hypothetical protein [Prevotellaceae bacterium]
MKRYYNCLFVVLVLLTLSCRKEFPKVNDPANNNYANDFKAVFENFWNGMNNNYIFWDTDTTDWDKVYRHYQPLFAQLNIENSNDVKTAYLYLEEMTSTLIDCHLCLTFASYYNLLPINPSWERKKKLPDFHNPISRNSYFASVFDNYCDLENKAAGVRNSFMAVSATIEQKILYLYLSELSLTEIYSENSYNQVKQAVENFFDLLKNTAGIRGVILDLRGTGGGYLLDLNLLLGQMVDTKTEFGYTRCKTGDGRLDYSPWIPAYISPAAGAKKVTAPIVVLGDMYSASMAEITIIAVNSLPNGYFIGEQTWGAQGSSADIEAKFNSGIFECQPFFEEVMISSHAFKDKNGKQYENIGLRPIMEAKHDQQALNSGKDTQLELAIRFIKQL